MSDVEGGRNLPARQDAQQGQDFVLGPFAGERWRVEGERLQGEATFGRQPSRDRGIDAAREQQHPPARDAHRQPARSGSDLGKDIDRSGMNLDADAQARPVHVYLETEGCDDGVADVAIDGMRAQGKALVGAAGLHFEGAVLRWQAGARPLGLGERRAGHGRQIGRGFHPGRDGDQPEDALQAAAEIFALLVGSAHQDATVGGEDLGSGQVTHGAAHVVGHRAQEEATIAPLEEELTIAAQDGYHLVRLPPFMI